MTVDMTTKVHATGYPANVLASKSGEHIFSIVAGTDTDNGNLVAVGDWKEYDVFKEAAVTTFQGEIVEKATSGNWLVLVKNAGDACLVYTKPLSKYETPAALALESSQYNKTGDVMRAYKLHDYDRIEVSEAGFSGTPKKGAKITGVTNKRLVIA